MNIAFISYEFPPDTPGGIGTYTDQSARMLVNAGHNVEVFAGGSTSARSINEHGVVVHRLAESDQFGRFPEAIGQVFAERHRTVRFDVLESPEFGAQARVAIRLVPDVAFVVKFHTPHMLLNWANAPRMSLVARARVQLGAIRRGIKPWWYYDRENDQERIQTLVADESISPSHATARRLTRDWDLDASKISIVPHVYEPSDALLDIPVDTDTNTVMFLGNLHTLKGIFDFIDAIPLVLARKPHTLFRVVGRPNPRCPVDHLTDALGASVKMIGFADPLTIPEELSLADVCVFPSIWETFPFACVEAMAAARAVVASDAGGLPELLDGGASGRIVRVRSPKMIANAVIELLENRALRQDLGRAARSRVLSEYNSSKICPLQESAYRRAIRRRSELGPRI